ncbi:phosphoribosylformylglycinamidine synthase subunit PurS [Helicobacter cetorum]|uniref:phosphoribosylformylglycinamidine synthase subunit PurS n=1 Tax=Helicobacter cetorum TaxID=138563 RepID=UPI000CF1BA18|nr:phosphoribosylformylglycinamidine synthase subunit PurS [Helicobacter cetorum]
MQVEVRIFLKEGVLDPTLKALESSLNSLGFDKIKKIALSKSVLLELETTDKKKALQEARLMAEKLLANPITEHYEILLR